MFKVEQYGLNRLDIQLSGKLDTIVTAYGLYSFSQHAEPFGQCLRFHPKQQAS